MNSLKVVHTDILVSDIKFGTKSVFDLIRRETYWTSHFQWVFLADTWSDLSIEQALKIDAAGMLSKDETLTDVIGSLRLIATGKRFISAAIAERITKQPGAGRQVLRRASRASCLTERQAEVLRYLATGLSTKKISTAMSVAEKTVESHKYRIMKCLGIHDRVELALFAIREGIASL